MSLEPIDTFVLAAPGRDGAHARCFTSIEQSDIGEDYTLCMHPPGVDKREHWRATLDRAAHSCSEYVLVLEDDVLVNRHILHNCRTWKWPRDPHFGAGWLYKPGGLSPGLDEWYTKDLEWYGSIAVLYRRELLPRFLELAWQWLSKHNSDAWDCAISRAVTTGGYGIRMHSPSLAEHLDDEPSLLGHPPNWYFRTSRGTYQQDWRRALGDRHGQFV